MPSNKPCPTCTTQSAWGCPVHAPKHMGASKATEELEASTPAEAVKLATLQMYAALLAAEEAADIHVNCEDCMSSGKDPAACEECVPSWDNATQQREAAIKAYEKAVKEAAKPAGPLYDRILAALQSGPMVVNTEWRARQIAEMLEADRQDVDPLPELVKCGTFTAEQAETGPVIRVGRELWNEAHCDAKLWREVRPLLHDGLFCGGSVSTAHLYAWLGEHKSDLEEK